MATFVFNDEKIKNSYGFSIKTAGIDLERFKNNPVMLNEHYNSTYNVLGKWENIKAKDGVLSGEDDFDVEDEDAKKIKGKVDRGYIKGVSMGVRYFSDDMKVMPDGTFILTRCELMEVSICAVPSNANALRLYSGTTGKLLTEDELKLSLSALTNPDIKNEQMEKIALNLSAPALTALGLSNADDTNAVSAAIMKLHTDLQTEKTAREALQKKAEEQQKLQAETLVKKAVSEGRMTADLEKQFVDMAMNNYQLAASVIATMPVKTSLSGKVNNTTASAEVKTIDDFEKLSLDQQLAFRSENPEAYKKLFA